jgi:hypothetical protein
VAFALAIALVSTPTFANSVHLTGNLQADYLKAAHQIIGTFTSPDQPPFAGVGWEVIIGKVGFGGTTTRISPVLRRAHGG